MTFRPPWPTSPGPRLKLLDGSISLKFLLGTRLTFESFDTLDDLLRFRIQRYDLKTTKLLINPINPVKHHGNTQMKKQKLQKG